jgi:hypothetical protein
VPPDVGASPQRAAHEQATVLGEQDAALPPCPLDEVGVVGIVAVRGVDAQQPQPPGERPEVDIEQEAGAARQALRAGWRVELDHRAVAEPVGHRRPHLGQRDAERLHDVADRRPAVVRHHDLRTPPPRREEEPQRRGWTDHHLHPVEDPRLTGSGQPVKSGVAAGRVTRQPGNRRPRW